MYRGTIIEQLINSVELAEMRALNVRVTEAKRPVGYSTLENTYIYDFLQHGHLTEVA